MSHRIAIVNDHRWIAPRDPDAYARNILDEDRLLTDAFERAGADTQRVDWADGSIDWAAFDAAVIRQVWDYFERYAEFQRWLDRVEPLTRVFNPVAIVRWNCDKRYLVELAEAGIPTVPTRVVGRRADAPPLGALMDAEGLAAAVIKPAVSGAGRETHRIARGDADAAEPRWQALVRSEDMLLQPFQDAIVERGEVSLIVIDGAVTHAVRKIAAPGEFRVQDDHGGTVHPHHPTAAETRVAERAIAAVPGTVLYARVDLVDTPDGPAVMELELIEPELFFRNAPAAAGRLAEGVCARLDADSRGGSRRPA